MDASTPHAAGAGGQVYCLRVVVAGISPLIWRQLEVAGSTTLAELHRILQAAFGWSGEHLHCFTVRGVDYRVYQGEGLPDGKDADSVTLAALGLRVAERFSYDYAFFSTLTSWRHDLRVQAIAPPRTRPRLPWGAGGARGAPPEDCGGPQVFVALRQEHSAWQATVRLAELMRLLLDAPPGDTVRSVLGQDALDELPALLYWARIDRFDKAAVNAALGTLCRTPREDHCAGRRGHRRRHHRAGRDPGARPQPRRVDPRHPGSAPCRDPRTPGRPPGSAGQRPGLTRALDQHRHCPECDTAFRRKDIKTIRLTTLFGVVAVDSPRYRSCPCRVREVATVSPLTTVLTEHTTPETVYMQARFAAVMSYRPAAALLGEVFPLGRTLHAAGVREQTHRVAARLHNERGPENTAGFSCCPRDLEDLPVPALPLVVGLDGGYVHSAAQTSRSNGWFEVIAGKSIPTDGEGDAKCFAFVQTIETKPRRRLHEVLTAQGVQANQAIIFLTDGGEDVRDLPRYLYTLSEHYLDWFHITMRLTVLSNTAKSLTPLPEVPDFAARIGADLERLKWLLWHGNTVRTDQMLSWLEDDLYVDDETADPPIVQVKLAKYFHEFATYIRANAHLIPNYGERYRCGEAISSAIAESTVNQVVSKRMCKKQQMHWSPTGAQLFLQIRTAVLNNDLAGHFQRWYPAFTHPDGPAESEVDLAA